MSSGFNVMSSPRKSYCPSYCNDTGFYKDGFFCGSTTAPSYCCGSASARYCCFNSSLDISKNFQDQCFCRMTSCGYGNWEAIVACVSTVAFISLLIFICCCQNCRCCFKCKDAIRHRSSHTTTWRFGSNEGRHSISGSGGRRLPSVSMTVSDQATTTNDLLVPSTGIVAPPSYDSLEKSPPKYEEVSHCDRQHMLPSCYTTQPSSIRQPITSVTSHDDAPVTGMTGSTGDDHCASRSCSTADGAVTSGPVPTRTRLASLPGSPGLLLSASQLPSYDEVIER